MTGLRALATLAALLLCQRAAPATFPAGEIVDLTHPFDARTIFWPTADPFVLESVAAGRTPEGYYYAANRFSMAEHGGTHVDAPVHFVEGAETVDAIPLDRLVGDAVVVDVSAKCLADADHRIGTEDLRAWETAHGRIPDRTIVLLRTGYGRFWPDPERYLGTAARGPEAVARLHFPGLDPAAARWLADERAAKAVGLDTASIDYGQSKRFETHVALFERGVPAFENVANLDRLPARGATIVALPMKIRGGTGGPLRIIAVLPVR